MLKRVSAGQQKGTIDKEVSFQKRRVELKD